MMRHGTDNLFLNKHDESTFFDKADNRDAGNVDLCGVEYIDNMLAGIVELPSDVENLYVHYRRTRNTLVSQKDFADPYCCYSSQKEEQQVKGEEVEEFTLRFVHRATTVLKIMEDTSVAGLDGLFDVVLHVLPRTPSRGPIQLFQFVYYSDLLALGVPALTEWANEEMASAYEFTWIFERALSLMQMLRCAASDSPIALSSKFSCKPTAAIPSHTCRVWSEVFQSV